MGRMMRLIVLLTVVLVYGTTNRAHAGFVVDQSQLISNVFIAAFGQTDLAQSFQQSNSNITGASIQLENVGIGLGDVTISLYNNLPNNGGSLLASGTDFGVSHGDFVTVSFGSIIAVIPDTTYYLVFTSTNDTLGIAGSDANPYSRGIVYANPGYGAFPTLDYAFQTYAFVGSVPEPSSLAMCGIAGVIGLAVAQFRRKRVA
jgi:PEP-CTERM motif